MMSEPGLDLLHLSYRRLDAIEHVADAATHPGRPVPDLASETIDRSGGFLDGLLFEGGFRAFDRLGRNRRRLDQSLAQV